MYEPILEPTQKIDHVNWIWVTVKTWTILGQIPFCFETMKWEKINFLIPKCDIGPGIGHINPDKERQLASTKEKGHQLCSKHKRETIVFNLENNFLDACPTSRAYCTVVLFA